MFEAGERGARVRFSVAGLMTTVRAIAGGVAGAAVLTACVGGRTSPARASDAISATLTATHAPDVALRRDERRPVRASDAPGVGRAADPVRPGLLAGFARVRDSIQARAGMPLRLPRVALGDSADRSLYVLVLKAVRDRYFIVLSDDADCPGGSVCRVATVAGECVLTDSAPPRGERVALAGGRAGMYVAPVCGAGCSDAAVVWREGRYRYQVGLKTGSKAEVVRMANSALLPP